MEYKKYSTERIIEIWKTVSSVHNEEPLFTLVGSRFSVLDIDWLKNVLIRDLLLEIQEWKARAARVEKQVILFKKILQEITNKSQDKSKAWDLGFFHLGGKSITIDSKESKSNVSVPTHIAYIYEALSKLLANQDGMLIDVERRNRELIEKNKSNACSQTARSR